MITNTIIKLEEFDTTYLEKSFKWLNDPIIINAINASPVSAEAQATWYNNLHSRKDYKIWGVNCNGTPIGACGLKHIEISYQAEYWGYIGEKVFWGQGIGYNIINELSSIAVDKYNLKSLYLHVNNDNIRALRLYEKSGFFKEESSSDNKTTIKMRKNL